MGGSIRRRHPQLIDEIGLRLPTQRANLHKVAARLSEPVPQADSSPGSLPGVPGRRDAFPPVLVAESHAHYPIRIEPASPAPMDRYLGAKDVGRRFLAASHFKQKLLPPGDLNLVEIHLGGLVDLPVDHHRVVDRLGPVGEVHEGRPTPGSHDPHSPESGPGW